MVGHRFRAEGEVASNVAVAVALSDEIENHPLALGEFREELRQDERAGSGEEVDQPLGNGRAENGFPTAYGANGAQDLVLVGVLEDVTTGTGAQSREDGMLILYAR
jgi:hypothetical protein